MRRFRFWGKTRLVQGILIILGVAVVLLGIRALDQSFNYDVVDVGPGYIYHPYVDNNDRSSYYGVHVHIDSMHTDEAPSQRSYDLLYTILQHSGASQLPVEVYYNKGTGEIAKVSYQGRMDDFEGSKSSQVAFSIVLELAGVALLAANVVAFVQTPSRRSSRSSTKSPTA